MKNAISREINTLEIDQLSIPWAELLVSCVTEMIDELGVENYATTVRMLPNDRLYILIEEI